MKKFSFLALAAAGMLLAACSSDREVAEGPSPVVSEKGEGYVGISISLPSADGTRANDDLTNGRADEFEVKNAYLYLFKGASEADAFFLKRYPLTNNFQDDTEGEYDTPAGQTGVTLPNGTAITQTSVSVCKIQNVGLNADEKLYAFVVVNAQGDLSAEPAAGTPFSDISVQEMIAADHGGTLEGAIGDDGLLMTNSPISDKGAGSAAPTDETLTTLAELNPSAIKNTREAALAAPAGCVYVERAAAKVTVTMNTTASTIDVENEDGQELAMDVSEYGWMVINTEPSFYCARQIESDWDPLFSQYWTGKNTTYRFISKYDFAPTLGAGDHFEGYRTYFAKDLQYDKAATLEHTVAGEDGRNWLGATDRAFVTENTFDVDRQMRTNTTQVTLRVKFNNGADFFTISDDAKYYVTTTIDDAVAARVAAMYNVHKFMEDLKDYELTQLKAQNSALFYKASVAVNVVVDKSAAANEADYEVTYTLTTQSSATETGTYTDCTPVAVSAALTSAWESAVEGAKAAIKVSVYKGGLSYYNVRIQHFGEVETPWDSERASQPGETIEQIYGPATTRTADYLGRYGVVRDNWYNLSIDGITKLGSAQPKPVDGDTTPDDEIEKEYYISAHVHILPWVIRTQNVNLK